MPPQDPSVHCAVHKSPCTRSRPHSASPCFGRQLQSRHSECFVVHARLRLRYCRFCVRVLACACLTDKDISNVYDATSSIYTTPSKVAQPYTPHAFAQHHPQLFHHHLLAMVRAHGELIRAIPVLTGIARVRAPSALCYEWSSGCGPNTHAGRRARIWPRQTSRERRGSQLVAPCPSVLLRNF
jgi:hypothetical protein